MCEPVLAKPKLIFTVHLIDLDSTTSHYHSRHGPGGPSISFLDLMRAFPQLRLYITAKYHLIISLFIISSVILVL